MILSVSIVPNASRTEIVGWVEGALKIRLAAPPVDGKANEALIRFLAKTLDLAPSEIEIKAGHGSKHKRLEIPTHPDDLNKAVR